MSIDFQLVARRAVEALRSGVPSRWVVSTLGTDQVKIVERFQSGMAKVRSQPEKACQDVGFFVRGSFGSGKSHVLKYLEQLALSLKFACSIITISKETPLDHAQHVYKAATDNLRLPDRPHGGLSEAALKLNFSSRQYTDFYAAVQSQDSGLAPLFGVTLQLFEGIKNDPAFTDQIVSYWNGNINRIFELRKRLRQLGASILSVSSERGDRLAFQRFNFASRLLMAAGYVGWVVLLDEVELVAKFSPKARIKSYAVLAGLLGRIPQLQIPGLLTVAGITGDFEGEVVNVRHDRDRVEQLRSSGDEALAENALLGLDMLRDERLHEDLRPVNSAALESIATKVRDLYATAYSCRPSEIMVMPQGTSMRIHVREWITRWDLERSDASYVPTIERDTLNPNLAESEEMEFREESD